MNFSARSRLLFIGDSITDDGRDPAGELCSWLPDFGLGHGCVNQVWSWLTSVTRETANTKCGNGPSAGQKPLDNALNMRAPLPDTVSSDCIR